MTTATVIHVVPQLPPAHCGVADFAAAVGRRIEERRPEVQCAYLAAGHRAATLDRSKDRRRSLAGACHGAAMWQAVSELVEESPQGASEPSAVVLHYSGYGYDASGAPRWLSAAIERRPKPFAACRVVTFFHELYATGRPWQRAFWASGRQRAVAIRLARASDAVITNRRQSARWLEKHAGLPDGGVPHLPISSTVGEPEQLLPWSQRPRRAVTFGAAAFKQFALHDRAEAAAALLARMDIDELLDLGEPTPLATAAFERRGIRVRALGWRPADEVSATLHASRVGLLNYNAAYLEKSSVYAAFAAHGVGCVMPQEPAPDCRDLPFVRWTSASTIDDVEQAAAGAARAYAGHSTAAHARAIERLIAASADDLGCAKATLSGTENTVGA